MLQIGHGIFEILICDDYLMIHDCVDDGQLILGEERIQLRAIWDL